MATLGEIRDEILTDLDRPELSAQVERALHRAIKHHGAERFWFNETHDYTFDLTAGEDEYELEAVDSPTPVEEFIEIDLLEIQVGGIWHVLSRADHIDVAVTQSGTPALSQPRRWSYFGGLFRFDPVPDSNAYAVRVHGHYRLPAIENVETEENVWTTIAEDLIREYARGRVMRTRRDMKIAEIAAADEAEALERLREEDRKRKGRGTIRGWW